MDIQERPQKGIFVACINFMKGKTKNFHLNANFLS
jgi:hypothetical protein